LAKELKDTPLSPLAPPRRLPEWLTGRYATVVKYSVASLAVFTLLRFALLVRSWGELGKPWKVVVPVLVVGLLYDLAFALYFALGPVLVLLLLPERVYRSRITGFLGQLFFFAYLCGLYFVVVAEWVFWNEFYARFNFIAVDYLVYRREVTENINESYPMPWILSGIALAAAVHWFFARRCLRPSTEREPFLRRLAVASGVVVLAVLAISLLGQGPREAFPNNFAKEVASDGPYQFFAAFRNNTLDYRQFYAQGEDQALSDRVKRAVGKDPHDGGLYDIGRPVAGRTGAAPMNIILVSVESLSADFMARFGNTQGITPFLDGWAKESLLFTRLYATGTRTDRGLEAISLSVPPTPGRSVVKRPENGGLYSLGKVLEDRGYDTAFLYGGRAVFDNMRAFFSGNGYRIVDQGSLKGDEITFSNAWGVADEDLFRRAIREADADREAGRPFFFHIMTTSNHRPYTYPEGKIDIPSGTGREGAVKYTDYALGQLVTEARKHAWFDDTLFVVVADHCSSSAGRVGLPVEKYHIPLFLFAPAHVRPGEVDKVASQIDIAPTVLALLGAGYDDHFWGCDILADSFHPRALIGNYQKLGLLQEGRLVILSPGRRVEVMDSPESDERIRRLPPDDPLAQEAMAYYQGADYILSHRMNRWH